MKKGWSLFTFSSFLSLFLTFYTKGFTSDLQENDFNSRYKPKPYFSIFDYKEVNNKRKKHSPRTLKAWRKKLECLALEWKTYSLKKEIYIYKPYLKPNPEILLRVTEGYFDLLQALADGEKNNIPINKFLKRIGIYQ